MTLKEAFGLCWSILTDYRDIDGVIYNVITRGVGLPEGKKILVKKVTIIGEDSKPNSIVINEGE